MNRGTRRSSAAWAAILVLALSPASALAHPGGLDASGGHHCRQAGYDSGKCSPLNSYHSHSGSGSGGDTSSGGTSSGGTSSGGTSSGGTSSGGTSSGGTSSAPTPPADTTPPDAPQLGSAKVTGATVTLPVSAERGSRLRFAIGGAAVHTATADGAEQQVSFELADGQHTIVVTATDAAGNTSDEVDFEVTVDTTPPDAPELILDVPSTAGAETTLALSGEKAATYDIEVAGPSDQSKKGKLSGSGETSFSWQLPNGDYTVTATLTDSAGNASEPTTSEFTVALPAPEAPSIEIVSAAGASPITVAVAADGAEYVVVSLSGEAASDEATVVLDASGEGTAEFDVPDGTYGVQAIAVDFQDQSSGAVQEADIIVKTSLPALSLSFVDELLGTGLFAYELLAEEGAVVRIMSDTEALLAEFTATGAAQSFSFEVPSGEHIITVSVIDAFGNETVEAFTAAVSVKLGVGGWITLLVLLALVAGAGFGLWKLWRRFRSRSTPSSAPTMPPPPGPPALQP